MNDANVTFAQSQFKLGKKGSLQPFFTEQVSETVVHRISDKRDAGVSKTKTETAKAGTGGQNSHSASDGLLGSLLLEQFMGSVLCPLLPEFLQALDISNIIDAADEIWMDRRTEKTVETRTYYPLCA